MTKSFTAQASAATGASPSHTPARQAGASGRIRTVLLAVPLGEAVRNLLRTDTYRLLRDAPDVRLVILSQGSGDAEFQREFGAPNVVFEQLQPYRPSVFERAVGSFKMAMMHEQSSTVRVMARRGYGNVLVRLVPVARLLGRVFGESRVNRALGVVSGWLVPARLYADVFRRHQPDLVVVTRVLNYSADYPVLRQARHRGVPVVALCASWDNLTSKGFFQFGVDRLVVWNEVLRHEALSLFQFPADDVFVGGIPRFDDYFRAETCRTRLEFFQTAGLDPSRRLITYATGHAQLGWPYQQRTPEPDIVRFLATGIDSGAFGVPCQLLVRLHPQAKAEDYREFEHHPLVRIYAPGRPSAFVDRDLSAEENRLLAETMRYSDVVVNIASTITIDAAAVDTPVICVGFDFSGSPVAESVRRFYDFEHYRKLAQCNGYRRADTPEDLASEIIAYLRDRTRDADGRRRIVLQQCAFNDGRSGERVGRYLIDYLNFLPSPGEPVGAAPTVG